MLCRHNVSGTSMRGETLKDQCTAGLPRCGSLSAPITCICRSPVSSTGGVIDIAGVNIG